MSDVRTPKVHIPPCQGCGKPSMGACVDEMEPVSPAGEPIMSVTFWCTEDAPTSFTMMSDRLYPVYRILHLWSPSKMKVMRLSRMAQAERLQP